MSSGVTAVVIDTSIWVDYFRGKDKQLIEIVTDLVNQRRARLCGVILCELLSGISKKEDSELLKETMEALDYLEVSKATWQLAGETSNQLRSRGVRLPITDLVVGALVVEYDCELLTTDAHFDHIPGLNRFKLV